MLTDARRECGAGECGAGEGSPDESWPCNGLLAVCALDTEPRRSSDVCMRPTGCLLGEEGLEVSCDEDDLDMAAEAGVGEGRDAGRVFGA